MKKIGLSETEWKLMDALWEEPPKTITQLTKALEEDTGWGKNVIITMLKRLEAKGAPRGGGAGQTVLPRGFPGGYGAGGNSGIFESGVQWQPGTDGQ